MLVRGSLIGLALVIRFGGHSCRYGIVSCIRDRGSGDRQSDTEHHHCAVSEVDIGYLYDFPIYLMVNAYMTSEQTDHLISAIPASRSVSWRCITECFYRNDCHTDVVMGCLSMVFSSDRRDRGCLTFINYCIYERITPDSHDAGPLRLGRRTGKEHSQTRKLTSGKARRTTKSASNPPRNGRTRYATII